MSLVCKAIVDGQEVDAFKITVGQRVLLKCKNTINVENAQLLYDGDKYPLVILNGKSNTMEVTSYVAGKYTSDLLVLSTFKENIPITGFSWETITSVKGNEPFEAKGMINLKLPVWDIVGISILATFIILISWFSFKKHRQLKKDIDSINKFKLIRTPIDELQYNIKNHERNLLLNNDFINFVKNLEVELKLFLSITFKIPFHIWDIQKSLKRLKKQNFISYEKFYKKINLCISELQALYHDKPHELSQKECYKLSLNISVLSYEIHDFKEQ